LGQALTEHGSIRAEGKSEAQGVLTSKNLRQKVVQLRVVFQSDEVDDEGVRVRGQLENGHLLLCKGLNGRVPLAIHTYQRLVEKDRELGDVFLCSNEMQLNRGVHAQRLSIDRAERVGVLRVELRVVLDLCCFLYLLTQAGVGGLHVEVSTLHNSKALVDEGVLRVLFAVSDPSFQ